MKHPENGEPQAPQSCCSSCPSKLAAARQNQAGSTRRDFLLMAGMGLNVVAGALMGIPILGYVLSSFKKKSVMEYVSVGALTKFPVGETMLAEYVNPVKTPWDGVTAKIPCWVRRVSGDKFQVFAINCTHLGCPVRWFKESRLFMCPCHGGAFYEDGAHASGPPPQALYQYDWRITANGELEINAGHLPTLQDPLSKPNEATKST